MTRPHIVNVCFVGSLGLADYTLSLARALGQLTRSTIVTATSFSYPGVKFGGEVVRVFRRSRHYPVDIFRFFFAVLKLKPDVLVFQAPLKFPLLDAIVVRLLRATGIRVATTVHDVLPHYPRPWSPWVYRRFYGSFDRLIAHSDAAKAKLAALGATAPTLVVPHGLYDIYRVSMPTKQAARQAVGRLADDDFVVLFFGHVDERKGIAELLDVIEATSPAARIKFVIAGANGISPLNTRLRARLAAAASWPNCVVRDERIPFADVENYFLAADTVVLPYLEGTTSGVLKLAMAFGRPVVATNVGDAPETVPADAGIVIDHARVREELPRAMQQMQASYAQYSQRWLQIVSPYEWDVIARRYLDFLSDNMKHEKLERGG